jgi:ubiquinone/menaquinone biosynthesis C-methylase UbiE
MDSPHDHNAANEEKWSHRAASFDDRRYDYFRFLQRELVNSANLHPPCAFLDVGCGTGWAARYASAEYGAMFAQAGLQYARSSRLKILYPLKLHIATKESSTG